MATDVGLEFATLEVYTWTVNRPEDIGAARAMGVDGVISDYPDCLLAAAGVAVPGPDAVGPGRSATGFEVVGPPRRAQG